MRRAAVLVVLCMQCAQRSDAPATTHASQPGANGTAATASPPPAETAELAAELAASQAAATPPRKRKVVLHVGDSMVGYGHGLSLALKHRFEAAGIEYHWDAWTSANIPTVDHAQRKHTGDYDKSERLDKLLRAFHPDLVILNLGTNNLAIQRPEAYADGIRSIAKHLAEEGRDCLWVGPLRPKWSHNPGMFDVLQKNASPPCQYFDSSPVHPPLQSDDIHPTDPGGEQWASAIWDYLGEPPVD